MGVKGFVGEEEGGRERGNRERETETETERQTDRQTERQTDRQTDYHAQSRNKVDKIIMFYLFSAIIRNTPEASTRRFVCNHHKTFSRTKMKPGFDPDTHGLQHTSVVLKTITLD